MSRGDASLEPPLQPFPLSRRIAAEGLGTAMLLAIVVGSGIMGQRLAGGNDAIALMGNTLATGAGLVVLIAILGPISCAHFNPAVTAVFAARREIAARAAAAYIAAQAAGAILGVWLAHAMFAEPILQVSTKLRAGPSQALSEGVATFGLILTILASVRFTPRLTSALVGLYITAAYWFTASTSFANPAVTVARSLTDTFAGIAPASTPGFLVGQVFGAGAGALVGAWLISGPRRLPASN
jgi:glycerol uptake facilitator-like aquaporin